MNKIRRTRDVIMDMVEEYVECVDRMNQGMQVG